MYLCSRMIADFVRYLEAERRYSPLTVRNYRHDVEQFLAWLGVDDARFEPQRITTDDIREWILYRTETGRVSAASMNREISSLRALFRWLLRTGAVGRDVVEAWTKAYEADKVSIFGGIVATNCTVTREAAELMKPIFLEIIMAPKFDEGALEVLSAKKNLRLLEVSMDKGDVDPKQYVSVNGGLLVQDLDVATKAVTADMCVTKAKPAAEQMEDLNFGWHIVKHVKSNAIVAVKDGRTLGVGAGQMNRIGSAEIALKQAHAAGVTEGLVLASDGFFPFDDCVTLAAEYGVTAIVQPGGSVRDEDSIRKADEKGIAMVFTGERHFKH